jgi:uncharacterized protein (DUF1684 family)
MTKSIYHKSGSMILCLGLLAGSPAGAHAGSSEPAADTLAASAISAHEAEISEWRRQRHARLASDSGWLSLVGLEWLQQGENRLGSGDDADVRIPGGPADWGTITVSGDTLTYVPAAGAEVTIDDMPAGETRLVADSEGPPTVIRSGNLSMYVILRGSYALRIKDTRAPTLLAFSAVDSYPIDASWRFDARFTPAEPGQTMAIANVLGQSENMPVIGFVEFERGGHTYRLVGLAEQGVNALWFLFADRTSGRETYGAGRFLYSDGMPQNGRVVVDFNKAYNPPCAFNDYSTCPLPPQQNRLDVAVTAGEKGYHHN